MGILAFVTMLRETQLMKDFELSAFSSDLVRESELDKEFADVMAP